MLDTNTPAQISQTAAQAQQAYSAWKPLLIFTLAHIPVYFRAIKASGGFRNIFAGLWDGTAQPAKAGTPSAIASIPAVPQPSTQNQTHE